MTENDPPVLDRQALMQWRLREEPECVAGKSRNCVWLLQMQNKEDAIRMQIRELYAARTAS